MVAVCIQRATGTVLVLGFNNCQLLLAEKPDKGIMYKKRQKNEEESPFERYARKEREREKKEANQFRRPTYR
jgi:hypothetical protein